MKKRTPEEEFERLKKVEEANKYREDVKNNPKNGNSKLFDSVTSSDTGEDTAKRYDAAQEKRRKRYLNIFNRDDE